MHKDDLEKQHIIALPETEDHSIPEEMIAEIDQKRHFLSTMILKTMLGFGLIVLAYFLLLSLLMETLIFLSMFLLLWLNTHMLLQGWVGVFQLQKRKASGLIFKNLILLICMALLSRFNHALLPMLIATSLWVFALLFVFFRLKQED